VKYGKGRKYMNQWGATGEKITLTDMTTSGKLLRILLTEPLCPSGAIWGSVRAHRGHVPPMGLISVYTWLRHCGYDVDFLDTQFGDITELAFRQRLEERKYDVVGMSVFTPTADHVFATARIVKEVLPSSRIVLGGVHATAVPEQTMRQCPECDYIVLKEGEHTFEGLVEALAGNSHEVSSVAGIVCRESGEIKINPPRNFIDSLDSLPIGFYSDIDLSAYVPHATQYIRLPNYPLMIGRGCPYKCSFCGASTILGKKVRYHSAERIIEELKILKRENRARGVFFQDSTFTLNRKLVMKLMDLMLREQLGVLWSCCTRADSVDAEMLAVMRRAGCRQIFLGIESGNQSSLDIIRKGTTVEEQTRGVELIRSAGIRYLTSFIICLPGETEKMVRNTIEYAKSLRAPMAMFYLPVPYPGTELYRSCQEDGGLRPDANWSDYLAIDFDNPVYVNPNFGVNGMKFWYKRAWIDYYKSHQVWIANIRAIRSCDDLSRLVRGGRALGAMFAHGITDFMRQKMFRFGNDSCHHK